MVKAGRNDHQEYGMFQMQKIPAYVCQDTFVYHDKTGSGSALIKAAMEKNMKLVNKKGGNPAEQS